MPQTNPNGSTISVNDSNKAIYVNLKVMRALEAAIKQNSGEYDTLPPRRKLLDDVVGQMMQALYYQGSTYPYYYYRGHVTGSNDNYRWFESDLVNVIQGEAGIRNKGAWVEGLILQYLYGEGAYKYLTLSRQIQPRRISETEIHKLQKSSAEMPAAKGVESNFCPTTFTGEIQDK